MGVDKSKNHGAYQISCASLGNPNQINCVKLQTLSGAIVSSFNCTVGGVKLLINRKIKPYVATCWDLRIYWHDYPFGSIRSHWSRSDEPSRNNTIIGLSPYMRMSVALARVCGPFFQLWKPSDCDLLTANWNWPLEAPAFHHAGLGASA